MSSKETKAFIYNVILYICAFRKYIYHRNYFKSDGNKFIAGRNYHRLFDVIP